MRRHVVFYLLPLLLGVALFGAARALHRQERDRALELWALAMDVEARAVATEYDAVFRRIYEGLRTIARLPSVRRLQSGRHLDEDAYGTAQEIYNNLAHQVAMSEVYVLPDGFDPDAVDPATGATYEPLISFDELIVGRTADNAAPAGESADPDEHRDHDAPPAHADDPDREDDEDDEIELFEYRQMRYQIARLHKLCPDDRRIAGLDYPVLCSPEVVTCDNRYFSPSRPDDHDRRGLVYSVPRFAPDGRLAGCVSGIVLSRELRQMLPNGCYALGNREHGFVAPALQPGVWQLHIDDIVAGRPAANLPYSRLLPLRIPDYGAQWLLWVGRSQDEFDRSPYAQKADAIFFGICVAILALVLGLAFAARLVARQRRLDRVRAHELEQARDAAVELARAKSNFVAVASHEIRTPMNGVLGMTDLLLQSNLPPAERELAETARQSAGVLVDLIQGILDYSRIEADKLELEHVAFDPVAAVEDVVQLLAPVAAQKRLPLLLHLDPDLPRGVVGDPGRLRQVVTNLLGNAIKFTQQGHTAVRLRARGTADAPRLQIDIVDTGIGLDTALKDRLFQPFAQADSSTTRRFGGSGLGLAISRGLVQAMGGTIDYAPTPGGGTTFTCTIPFAPSAQPTPAPRPLAGHRLVLVDGDPERVACLSVALQMLGATVLHEPDAGIAARRLAESTTTFDAVLVARSDDGGTADLRALVRALPSTLPVVAVERWFDADAGDLRSTARIRMPARLAQLATMLREPEARTPLAPAATRSAPGHAGRALIADDNEVNLRVACLMMKKLGYSTVEARDGEEAAARAVNEPYDVVLMDWQMPRLDGIAATERIRAAERELGRRPVPIVAVTANALPDDERRCLEAGMNAFLSKPISSERLALVLQELRSAPTDAPTNAPT